jgi:pimeloyl-ACP methyl ester carboxylesterase
MHLRTYGNDGPLVIVLHGGPGAPGYMAPVARGLAESFRVLEPFQRGSGGEPLSVARHVDDLRELIQAHSPDARPAIVGSSWGAMLALAFAARYPDHAGPLVLIGCGTFDPVARQRLQLTIRERMDTALQQRLDQLANQYPDANERLRAMAEVLLPVYSCDVVSSDLKLETCDALAYSETWNDMLRLQVAGVYPAAFCTITLPVLMLHGKDDPHPGAMIRASLRPYIPHLEYREFDRCGHYPWLERAVRDEFFTLLRAWLTTRLSEK